MLDRIPRISQCIDTMGSHGGLSVPVTAFLHTESPSPLFLHENPKSGIPDLRRPVSHDLHGLENSPNVQTRVQLGSR